MAKLLIVDDENAVISAIVQTLQGRGYSLAGTTDPLHALEMLRADASIDLLITDLFMPEMDGSTLLNLSRQIRPDLRIVVTTGAASEQEVRRWRRKGELLVQKPWRDREFITAVEAALSRNRSTALLF